MPRGRPPIPRSKEEALNIRRSQIRKNVQAFRKRQKEEIIEGCPPSRYEEEGITFVLEDAAQWKGQVRTGHHIRAIRNEKEALNEAERDSPRASWLSQKQAECTVDSQDQLHGPAPSKVILT